MSTRRYKITLDIYNEKPYNLPDEAIFNDVFIYNENTTDEVLRSIFNEMLILLKKEIGGNNENIG